MKLTAVFNRIYHEFLCLIGRETKTVHQTFTHPTITKTNASEAKTVRGGTAPATTVLYTPLPKTKRSIRVRLINGLKISLWLEIALLVIREVVPEIANQLPAVYQFLDTAVVPVINWLYAIGVKIVNTLLANDAIKSIIDWLASLAI